MSIYEIKMKIKTTVGIEAIIGYAGSNVMSGDLVEILEIKKVE